MRNGSADKPKSDPDEKKTPPGGDGKEDQPGTDPVDPKAEDDKKDGDNGKGDGKDGSADNGPRRTNNGGNGVGNPGNGNCGNSGSNGNARTAAAGAAAAIPTIRPRDERPPTIHDQRRVRHHLTNPVECDDKNKDRLLARVAVVAVAMATESGSAPGTRRWRRWRRGCPEVPSGRPELPPQMQLPPELMPPETEPGPTVIDAEPGVGHRGRATPDRADHAAGHRGACHRSRRRRRVAGRARRCRLRPAV